MTPDQRSLVSSLVVVPGGRPAMSGVEFLRRFGASDGPGLGAELVRDAAARRSAVDVELALVVCAEFGYPEAVSGLFAELAFADWHQRHEDVAWALGRVSASGASVNALVHLATWVPAYLAYDGARALASKAVHSLGMTGSADARRALEVLSHGDDELIAGFARRQLDQA